MRRTRRLLVALAGLLAVTIAAGVVLGVVTVRRPFPVTTGTVVLDGLDGRVEILRDDHGIPQVYADTSDDLFFGQGYVQAQDRFWEMDFRRHVTAGRLAELVGPDALETDQVVRTLGWRRVAAREMRLLSPRTRAHLRAYSNGVNAYLEDRSGGELSLEYALLSVTGVDGRPEPWTPVDSLAWLKAMAWDLRSNMSDEIERVQLATAVGPDRVAELFPDYPYARHDPIVTGPAAAGAPTGPAADPTGPAPTPAGPGPAVRRAVAGLGDVSGVTEALDALPALLGSGEAIGSNSWVVSGDRSATGEPLLANDPHLAPSMPGIWYETGLHCREVGPACPYDVSGFTFAGMPGVVIGHNADVAWGITTMYPDVTDLYVEQVDGDRYRRGRRWVPLTERTETFEVAGEDPVTTTVRSTVHGPIISDVDDGWADVARDAPAASGTAPGSDYALSLQWTALTPGATMDAVFGLDRAGDWADFRDAARRFDVPSQNLVYADTEGHVGYQAPGVVPVRRTGDGLWPAPGWDRDYGWDGQIPFADLPSVLDPPSGYVVTANNAVVGPGYPYDLTSGEAPGYRSQRIVDTLAARDDWTVDDLAALQLDTYDANAAQVVPHLLDVDPGGGYMSAGQTLLADWDLHAGADSAAAAYFAVTWRALLARTFHDELPEVAWPTGGERWFEVVRGLLDEPDSPWWDDVTTRARETRDDVLRAALRDATAELTSTRSRYPERWAWGDLHTLDLVNPTLGSTGTGLVDALFNRGPYDLGGGGGIVDATGWDATEGYEVTAVPSMRMVVSLGDLDASRWIQLTGESGHAFHEHYTDQTELWAAGETLPWAFSREAVEAGTDDVLLLAPPGG